jgi:CPA1 family monovalent cation:H+ antiporter
VTLLVQGLTLAPLIRWLRVATAFDLKVDVRKLHRLAAEAALEELAEADGVPDEIRAAVVRQYEARRGYRDDVLDLVDGDRGGEEAAEQLRRLLARATEAERSAVLEARRAGDVSPAAADDVLFDVEARALRYEG